MTFLGRNGDVCKSTICQRLKCYILYFLCCILVISVMIIILKRRYNIIIFLILGSCWRRTRGARCSSFRSWWQCFSCCTGTGPWKRCESDNALDKKWSPIIRIGHWTTTCVLRWLSIGRLAKGKLRALWLANSLERSANYVQRGSQAGSCVFPRRRRTFWCWPMPN